MMAAPPMPCPSPTEAWVTIDDVACDGSGSVLSVGDVLVPPHGASIATGYDDSYNVTPQRLLRNMMRLGYRGAVNHYVGMSHYYRLDGGGLATATGGALNVACAAWHADWAARLKAAGLGLIVSLSYELFDANCPAAWKQRAANGDAALTGYVPPSTLLSPASTAAMGYLQAVARAFVQIAVTAGQAPRFPDRRALVVGQCRAARICLYDDAARAALGGDPVVDCRCAWAVLSAAADGGCSMRRGCVLAASTAALFAAVRGDHADLRAAAARLFADRERLKRRPKWCAGECCRWAGQGPRSMCCKLEDYDWVTAAIVGASARARAAINGAAGLSAWQTSIILRALSRAPRMRRDGRRSSRRPRRAVRRGDVRLGAAAGAARRVYGFLRSGRMKCRRSTM